MTLATTTLNVTASVAREVFSPGVRPLADPPARGGLRPVLGDAGPPLVGHSLDMLSDLLEWARRRHARFGEVSWGRAFGTDIVLVLGPDGIGEVLGNKDRAFSNKEGWEYLIGPFFDRGVMLMDFDEHRSHRQIMQQAFRKDRLIAYLQDMNPAVAAGLDRWPERDRFELYTAVKQLTLDLATEVFVGERLGTGSSRINEAFVDTVHGGGAVVRADVPGGRWRRGLQGRRFLEDYFRGQIAVKRAGEGRDLFSVLCAAESEDGDRFTDDDVVNHMIFVLMAAHDTSTTTVSMMGYLLGRHRDWQERLREESLALGTDALDYSDLDRLVGLDLVMKETLRMYAPVAILMRRALLDTTIADHHIPAGTYVALGLYPSHRMAQWWSKPDTFDPERFADGRREDQSHKFAWTPFGGHVHKCIGLHFAGMEVKAIMHQMLLRFSWSVPDHYQPPIALGTGPMPADGLPIRLSRRRTV
ncbi:MAG: cytochrome P450 [Solirubrobacteraceae bacterium]